MKKIMVVLSILSMITTGATFAQGNKETTDNGKPMITYCFRDDGRGENQQLWQWISKGYNTWDKKDQVNLKIAPITASEGDYFTKIALQLSDPSTCPDLVTEDTFQLPNDVSAGYLTNLDPFVKNYKAWNDGQYYGAMKKAVSDASGSVYGIPYCTDTRGLWYNRALLTKAGVITEGEDWKPATWDDIMDASVPRSRQTAQV